MIKIVLKKFPTHVCKSKGKKPTSKHWKINNQAIYSGSLHPQTRAVVVSNLHDYLLEEFSKINIPKFNGVAEVDLIIKTPINHATIRRIKGVVRWKPPEIDYEPNWDEDNLTAIWTKVVRDSLVLHGVIDDDNVSFIRGGYRGIEFVNHIDDRELIIKIKERMKKLNEISLPITEKEYRELHEPSYSFLSAIDRLGPKKALEDVDPTTPMIFGTIVDSKMDNSFDPSNYHVMKGIQIGEKLQKVVDMLFSSLTAPIQTLPAAKSCLQTMLEEVDIDYYSNRTPEWRANKVCSDQVAIAYYQELFKAKDKTLIDDRMIDDADNCKKVLETHEFTRDIFSDNHDDCMYQFKYIYEYKGVKIKVMLDRIIVNHRLKTVSPYDLKTGGKSSMEFLSSFYKYRYDFQGFLYLGAVNDLIQKHFKGYKFEPFRFIYIGRYEKKPLVWEMDYSHIQATKTGFYKDGKKYLGIDESIKNYLWYKKNNFKVDYPEEIYNNNGIIQIKI